MSAVEIAPVELVESRILVIRRQKVLLDSDLAALYQVETKALNRAVRRNIDRFPEDFMFRLTSEEAAMATKIEVVAAIFPMPLPNRG
jgi:hypothetical protein